MKKSTSIPSWAFFRQFITPVSLVVVITILGFMLRGWQLGQLPSQLNRDEAALAYNALLLQETGQDEWQRSWPLSLESFGDFKLPGYPALLVVLFHFLPPEDWVVRLPSMLAGTALIPLAFWLTQRMSWSKRSSVWASLLICLTPIFFFYSRIGFEANVGLFLTVLGLYLWWPDQATRTNAWWRDLVGAAVFLWAGLTYNTPLLLLPFIVLTLPMLRQPQKWRTWLLPVVLGLLVFLGLFSQLLQLTSQKSSITIFSDETIWQESVNFRTSLPPVFQPVLGNKYLYFSMVATQNLVQTLSPQFMTISGGTHPWHALTGYGHILAMVYGFFIVGAGWVIVKSSKQWIRVLVSKKIHLWSGFTQEFVLSYLLLISLIPAIITVDAPHATRSLLFFFLASLLAVKGVQLLLNALPSNAVRQYGTVIAASALVLAGGQYVYHYFDFYPQDQPESLKIGFAEAITYTSQNYPDQPVAVVDDEGFDYVLTAWYLQVPAQDYFATIKRQQPDKIGFRYGEQLLNFHFIAAVEDREKTGESLVLYRDNSNAWILKDFSANQIIFEYLPESHNYDSI